MKSTLSVLLIVISFYANAQKLPNVQQISLRAPANIKIDGKATEWNDQFLAYNKATEIFYTISNDDKNLYLTIQASDPDIIHKIVNGRISFSINKSGKKDDKDAVTISYPIFERKYKPVLNLKNKPQLIPGSTVSLKQADSFMYVNNTQMNNAAKMIKVTGVKGLDTLISVYNDEGVKAAALFNNKAVYTCEIAIALKIVGLSVNEPAKFSYNVKLNGIMMDDMPGVIIERNAKGDITSFSVIKALTTKGSENSMYATDFWGEYTLAKK